MEFKQAAAGIEVIANFAPARDIFWLAAFFLGAGFGCILNRFRKKAKTRFRNWTVTIGYCFFSMAVAALTAAAILSNWMIYRETALYLPAVIFTVIVIIAFRFPRAAGFPLFIISGLLAVMIGYVSLHIPAIDNTGGEPRTYSSKPAASAAGLGRINVVREGDGIVYIRELLQRGDIISFPAGENDSVLEFRAVCFDCPKTIPLIGGVKRGVITGINKGDELLYEKKFIWEGFRRLFSAPDANNKAAGFRQGLFTAWESTGKLDVSELQPGTGVTVLFDGSGLVFR